MNRFLLFVLLAFFLVGSSLHAAGPLVAKIKAEAHVYAGRPCTLDGSASTQAPGVTYAWKTKDNSLFIEKADQAIARFVPSNWGHQDVTLTVSRGEELQQAQLKIVVLNDPEKDQSLVLPGTTKLLYKQALDALGGAAKLYLHIVRPPDWKASDKRAAVMLFHGGSWRIGSPQRFLQEARYWASRGLVGITAQYRLGEREGVKPQDCVADAKSAVRYLRASAAEQGIDAQKIAVGGESAGAHIAACTGTVHGYDDPGDDLSVSCVPNAMILYFPYSMVTTYGNGRDDMSPLHFVDATTPPTLFIAGELDTIAPAERGIEWGERMKDGGNLFRLFIYRHARHSTGPPSFNQPGVANDVMRQSDQFLEALDFANGLPTVPSMDPAAIEALHVKPKDLKPLSTPKQ